MFQVVGNPVSHRGWMIFIYPLVGLIVCRMLSIMYCVFFRLFIIETTDQVYPV